VEFISKRKRDPNTSVRLKRALHLTGEMELALRPAFIIAKEVTPDFFSGNVRLPEVTNPLSKKLSFRADCRIQAGENKRRHIIAQALGVIGILGI
jgi:hypothetical protein